MIKGHINSPIGILEASASEKGIQRLTFLNTPPQEAFWVLQQPHLKHLAEELDSYFSGNLQNFTVPLDLAAGTAFQQNVWAALPNIPYGHTRSYKQQALQLGNLLAIRAMAKANGQNPVAILLPCHRVVGSTGSLTGYAGGLWRKIFLLELEQGIQSQIEFV